VVLLLKLLDNSFNSASSLASSALRSCEVVLYVMRSCTDGPSLMYWFTAKDGEDIDARLLQLGFASEVDGFMTLTAWILLPSVPLSLECWRSF